MIEFPFLIPIFAIVFGSLLSGFVIWKIVDLIKTWITRNNGAYDDETIDHMARAFIEHKKNTERRLQYIEAIIADDPAAPVDSENREFKEPQTPATLEIESRDSETVKKNESTGNLNNMLQKRKKE